MNEFLGLVVVATFIESTIQFVKNLNNAREKAWFFVAVVFGALVCVLFGIDFFQLVGLTSDTPYVGSILTGFIVGRGANFVHDMLKIAESKSISAQADAVFVSMPEQEEKQATPKVGSQAPINNGIQQDQ